MSVQTDLTAQSERARRSLDELVAAWAREQPRAVAIEDGEDSLTYGELDAAAAAIAAGLSDAGLGDEEVVAVCLPRSWQAVCSFLGALRAGGAYLPIDPEHPPKRQRRLLELAGVHLVLTGAGYGTGLPAGVRRLDAGELARRASSAPPPPIATGADRLAYVLFTSGSTGEPKGVEVTHGNLAHFVTCGAPVVVGHDDVSLHVVPLGFDLSAQEIWGTLANGGRLVIAPRGRPDPAELGRLIEARSVTALTISAGLFHELVHACLPRLAGLRMIASGGDVLSPHAATELRRAHPGVRLLNSYGPTEATIAASCFEVGEPDGGPVPIGRALPGYVLEVRDEVGVPVDVGEVGELWIGGPGVARGYRHDRERTEAAFPTVPGGGRMYRTGDRVRLRDDGELLFLARIDDQVKISGQRVEPGEVERALASHPRLRQAAVIAREDVPGHKRLVGYAVPRRGAALPSAEELEDHVASLLPPFMVPSPILLLDALPLNERGKVDRPALPAPIGPRPKKAQVAEGPVAELMAEVLRLDSIGPDENFFELGGTSLLAIQLAGRLRERLEVAADIGAVFEAPTPVALAERLATPRAAQVALPPLMPSAAETTAPPSAAQRRAWLFERMHPESIAYQFAVLFRFRGSLDPAALREALAALVRRHEILRTSFGEREEEPLQVIHAGCAPHFASVDLRGRDRGARRRLIRDRVRTKIDLGQAPLMRSTLARLDDDAWELLHIEHHAIHDGWSFTIFADELAELYSAQVERRPSTLAPLPVQFQDYARWEARTRNSEAVRRQVEHWVRRLDPEPPLIELPGARNRPARESFSGSSIRRRLDGELAARARRLAGENGVTLFMVALAAFLIQLRRYSGQNRIQIGSGLANRRDPNAERVIGMIVNTVVLRCDLGGDPNVRELLKRVREMALDAYANADAPFDAVVSAAGPRRDPRRSPLIQALFSFHDAPRGEERWAGLDVDLVQVLSNGTAKADLNVIGLAERDGAVTFVWEHSDLLSDAAADRLAGHHLQLMEQLVDRPDACISELDLLVEDELAELEAWNAVDSDFDRKATVPELVARQARRRPDAVAVLDDAQRLSYAELSDRAAAIAAMLRERGVERGDRVGVLLGRSTAAVAAQLGVLGAGAAYVPLDPRFPAARISQLLAAAGATAVLTNKTLRGRLPVGVAILDVESATAGEHAVAIDASPEDLAYLIYTSGSTGEPKGVEVTHRNIARLVDGPDYAELGPGSVMLHAASPAFDAATLEIWGPLANGGTIACLGEQPSPEAIAAAIERHGVTTLWLTAGLFHRLVDDRPECLASLRQLLAGGDVLSPEHVRKALAALPPDARLTNGYGPTETTTFATTYDLRPGDTVGDPVPIGRPIQATTCDVLDADGNPLPVGAAGELAIGGDGVARGYRDDPALTAARFRPDPTRPGARRYMTGDRVRRRPDGAIDFLGRVDRQVKIRGFRVEAAEVEAVVRAAPAVADAAVVPFEQPDGGKGLVAYVVTEHGTGAPEPDALRAHTAARLPTAMVPSAWVAMPRLPLTANGKLDRKRLPAPGSEHVVRERGGSGPRNARERRIVACFEEVLGLQDVGAEDDFFALGGHSLLAVELFGRLERIAGRRLPLSTIFEATTPRALATYLGSAAPADRWDNLIALKPSGSRPPLFAVAAGDGNIVGFAPLARQMPAEQPLYALQPSGLDGRRPLDSGIEEMAARYLAALRRVRPHGPYLLAGRCNGATVAFEMAQQLRAAGEKVPLLVVLDSSPPAPKPAQLAPGIPYDQMMETAAVRARGEGEEAPELTEPDGAARLLAWLREPLAPGVSRYLHEFWHWRSDLREAWPDPLGADAEDLVRFAWRDALPELVPALLPPVPAPGCRTADGQAWDWAMHAAWSAGYWQPPDPLSPAGWGELRRRLSEPLECGINRYLLGAWSRPDLQAAFPRPLDGDAKALRAWAWRHGIDEGLEPSLLPPPDSPLPRRRRLELRLRPSRDAGRRLAERTDDASRRLAREARLRGIEAIERRLDRPLPGAGERTIERALAAARRARAGYRADPWPGRVVLIVSEEFEDKSSYLGWDARALGGVERHHVPFGHVGMLREPGVAVLARCLEERIAEALGL